MINMYVYLSLQQQLRAYVAWVNSQLKKRPGSRSIEDLRTDMQDGVALVHLIEVVGKNCFCSVFVAYYIHYLLMQVRTHGPALCP